MWPTVLPTQRCPLPSPDPGVSRHLELWSLLCFSTGFFSFSCFFPLSHPSIESCSFFFILKINISSPYVITKEKCGLGTWRGLRESWPGPSVAGWVSQPLWTRFLISKMRVIGSHGVVIKVKRGLMYPPKHTADSQLSIHPHLTSGILCTSNTYSLLSALG